MKPLMTCAFLCLSSLCLATDVVSVLKVRTSFLGSINSAGRVHVIGITEQNTLCELSFGGRGDNQIVAMAFADGEYFNGYYMWPQGWPQKNVDQIDQTENSVTLVKESGIESFSLESTSMGAIATYRNSEGTKTCRLHRAINNFTNEESLTFGPYLILGQNEVGR